MELSPKPDQWFFIRPILVVAEIIRKITKQFSKKPEVPKGTSQPDKENING